MVADKGYGESSVPEPVWQRRAWQGGIGRYLPKEMTPMAWKMPLFIVRSGAVSSPRSAAGVRMPCITTVTMMMTMLTSARVLAFAS